MSATEIVSTQYQKGNCVCYEVFLNGEAIFSSLKIIPNENYCLKFTETSEVEDEPRITYINGYVQICQAMIADLFPQYEAVLIADIPESENIFGNTQPEVTE